MVRRLAAILAADVVGYTRLMEQAETATLDALRAHREEAIEPLIAEHGGRIVKLMGDGALVEFASVVDAVACAVAIQRAMMARNSEVPQSRRIDFRIGVHLGDVIVEGDDLYGAGINVAARIESLAEPGGICLSGQVLDHVDSKLGLRYTDLGEPRLKNVARAIRVYRVDLNGETPTEARAAPQAAEQEIRFCTAFDGAQIAYAAVGRGAPLVKAANWLNHLEYDWESPVWRHVFRGLAKNHRLVRYDARGNGLSDWDVDDISFEAFVTDLETVVGAAAVDRFDLLGISQGSAISIAYAVRHPERVRRLVIYGGYARGRNRRGSDAEREQAHAMVTLMRQGWGRENPAFRQLYTSLFVPDATAEQAKWFNDLQRITTSPENAVRIREAMDRIDVSEILPQVSAPTLVLHCRNDAVSPFEEGRRLAARIPNARFVALEGRNHLILEHEPAWPRFLEAVEGFLAEPD